MDMMQAEEREIRVVLAEGHTLVLAGIQRLLDESPDITVIGASTSGREALRLILNEHPDVALLDVDSGELSAIAVLQQLQGAGCLVPVIVLSGRSDRHAVQMVLRAGARGYVLKQGTSANLMHAIRSVCAGGLYLDADVAALCIATTLPHTQAHLPNAKGQSLTPREEEVIRLIALGFTAKEIGDQLGINARSVETHKARATDKLGLRSRAKIVQYGVLRGWFQAVLVSAGLLCIVLLSHLAAQRAPRPVASVSAECHRCSLEFDRRWAAHVAT